MDSTELEEERNKPLAPATVVSPPADRTDTVFQRIDPDTFKGKLLLNIIDKLFVAAIATIAVFLVQQSITNANQNARRLDEIGRVEFALLNELANETNASVLEIIDIIENFVSASTSASRQALRARIEASVTQIRLQFATASALVAQYGAAGEEARSSFEAQLDEIVASSIVWASRGAPPSSQETDEAVRQLLMAYPSAIQAIRQILLDAWSRLPTTPQG